MKNIKQLVLCLLILSTVLLFTGCGTEIQADAQSYIGKNYEDVIAELSDLGFKNIEQIPIEDIDSNSPLEDGYVENVAIDGDDSFKAGDTFSANAKVTVEYHEVQKLIPPIDADQIQKKKYKTLRNMFIEQGFCNVRTDEVYDLDPETTKEEYINEVIINDTNEFTQEDVFPFDADILIVCHYPYERYDATVKINNIDNWFLYEYDVRFLIDGKEKKTLSDGEGMKETFTVPEGNHVFSFESVENAKVNGKTDIDVTGDLEVTFEIMCQEDRILVAAQNTKKADALAVNQLKLSSSEAKFLGKKYKQVVKLLKQEGFEHVKAKPVYDLSFKGRRGQVKSVTIDDKTDYKRGDVFTTDTNVVVKYHLLEEEKPDVKQEQELLEAIYVDLYSHVKGKACAKARKYLKQEGYTVTSYMFEPTGTDYTEYVSDASDEELNDSGYVVTDIRVLDPVNMTISLRLDTEDNVKRMKEQGAVKKDLESKLSTGAATAAMKRYGEKQYPYGFELDELTGMLMQKPLDKDTWFLKCYVDVTDEQGKKQEDRTCEAKVEKKNGTVSVYDFRVY